MIIIVYILHIPLISLFSTQVGLETTEKSFNLTPQFDRATGQQNVEATF
jgi:hypothetical protein